MGQPTTNGNAGPSSSSIGSSLAPLPSNTASIIPSVDCHRPEGTLMYEDDSDWVDVQERNREEGGELSEAEMEGKVMFDIARTRPGSGGGKRMPVEREEAVRLILQALRDVGYSHSADVLEKESGFRVGIQAATDFENAILGARWSEALGLLPELGITSFEQQPESSSSGKTRAVSPFTDSTLPPVEQAHFLIAQQKYLEYLELGQQKKALSILRGELAKLVKDKDLLHSLSGLMMCLDKEDLYERAAWDGAAGISRRQLLGHLQAFISPKVMLPSRRLATLLSQARLYQQSFFPHVDQPTVNSLYTDFTSTKPVLPSVTTHVLVDHTDEVWKIEWSPDGNRLASAGKDRLVVVWDVEQIRRKDGSTRFDVHPSLHLTGHTDPVDAMAWSPDGKLLVTGAEKNVCIWDTESGNRLPVHSPSPHTDTISSIQFVPSQSSSTSPSTQEFLVTSMDCRIIFYSTSGTILRQWSTFPLQFNDCAITKNGENIVGITTPLKRVAGGGGLRQSTSRVDIGSGNGENASGSGTGSGATENGGLLSSLGGTSQFKYANMEHGIVVVRISDHEIIDWSQDLRREMTSIKLSSDDKRVLVSCSPDEVQEWSITPRLNYISRYTGHVQGNFLIRSCFGYVRDKFVLSGSEDGHVYVWQGRASQPNGVLSGHTNVVNAVAWNPVASRMLFASCSDDKTVRIWQPPVAPGSFEKDEEEPGNGSKVEGGGDGDGVEGMEL